MEPVVGSTLSRFDLPVEVSKAREMAGAVLSRDRKWRDAAPSELRGAVVVPTFTVTSRFWQDRHHIMEEQLGLDLRRTLHGEHALTFARRPVVGDVLRGTTTCVKVEDRRGRRAGAMRLVTLATAYEDTAGEPVLREELVLVEVEILPDPGGQTGDAPVALSGDPLSAPQRFGPVGRTDFVRYAGASGDLHPFHHDDAFVREQGWPSVFAMGMFQGGVLANHLDTCCDGRSLESIRLRFQQQLWPGQCFAVEAAHEDQASPEPRACRARATLDDGAVLVDAQATLRSWG